MARRLTASLLVIAALPALAACGGPSREEFRSELRPVNERIMDLGRDVGSAVTGASGKSDRQIQQEFDRLAARTTATARDLERLEAPEDVKDEQRDLVEALRDNREALAEIADAAGAGDPQAARRATIQLVAASDDLRAARTRIERAARGDG